MLTLESQRSVYMKFKSMGYPTDLVGRTRLLDASFLPNIEPDIESMFSVLSDSQSPDSATSDYLSSGVHPLPDDDMLVDSKYPWSRSSEVGSPALGPGLEGMHISREVPERDAQSESGTLCRNGPTSISPDIDALKSASLGPPYNGTTSSQSWSSPDSTFDQACEFPTCSMELNGAAYFSINNGSDRSQNPVLENTDGHSLLGIDGSNFGWNGVGAAEYGPSPLGLSSMELDQDPTSSTQETFRRVQRKAGLSEVKIPFPNLINTSSTTGARNKLRSLFKPKSRGSFYDKKRYPTSQYTRNTEDSGYASGYASCLTLEDIQRVDPQSLSEFNGLYRVACQNLHEPQGMAKCRDIPTCGYCRYSSIHNLGWSSRYLKFEVFLSELRLTEVYEFGALDAAGNTALHYAAAGGASFLHLKALIDAGVDASAANTAGELFTHCLRPLQPFTLEPNSDCLKGDDLIHLLELLQSERVFGWRDNNGQTILHALTLKIADPDLKAKIFK